jgi:MHS family alpha-ketoglutarate permease-like MFS transporter
MSFFSAYAISSKGMDENGAYLASLGAQVVALVALPLWGALSDRIGRKRQLRIWSLAVMVVVFPVSWLLTDEPWTLFVAQSLALIVWAAQASIHSTVMAEQAPTEARSTSVGVWSSVGAALTGGTAPYLNTWLTGLGLEWVFSAYIIALAVVTLITLRFIPETAGVPMDEIPMPGEAEHPDAV